MVSLYFQKSKIVQNNPTGLIQQVFKMKKRRSINNRKFCESFINFDFQLRFYISNPEIIVESVIS